MNHRYKDHGYWEKRFSEETDYEWLGGFEDCEETLNELLPKDAHTLVVGIGNSNMSREMALHGWKNLVNMDFSETVIQMQRSRNSDLPQMQWTVADMTQLHFEDCSFDTILDKAGMDALVVDEGDVWNPCEAAVSRTDAYLRGVSRILKPGGVIVQYSFAQPHHRLRNYLAHQRYGLRWEHREWHSQRSGIASAFGHFIYIGIKLSDEQLHLASNEADLEDQERASRRAEPSIDRAQQDALDPHEDELLSLAF